MLSLFSDVNISESASLCGCKVMLHHCHTLKNLFYIRLISGDQTSHPRPRPLRTTHPAHHHMQRPQLFNLFQRQHAPPGCGSGNENRHVVALPFFLLLLSSRALYLQPLLQTLYYDSAKVVKLTFLAAGSPPSPQCLLDV